MPWVAAFELIMDTALATMCEMIFRKARHAPGRKTVYAHGCVDAITALGIRQTAHPAARAWSDIRKSTMDEQLSHKYAYLNVYRSMQALKKLDEALKQNVDKQDALDHANLAARCIEYCKSYIDSFHDSPAHVPLIPLTKVQHVLAYMVHPHLFLSNEVMATLCATLELIAANVLLHSCHAGLTEYRMTLGNHLLAHVHRMDGMGTLADDSPLRPSVFVNREALLIPSSPLALVLAKQSVAKSYTCAFAPALDKSFADWRAHMHATFSHERYSAPFAAFYRQVRQTHDNAVQTVKRMRMSNTHSKNSKKGRQQDAMEQTAYRVQYSDLVVYRLMFDDPTYQSNWDAFCQEHSRSGRK